MGISLEKAKQTYTFLKTKDTLGFLLNKQIGEQDPKPPIQYTLLKNSSLQNYRQYRLWSQNPARQAELYEWRNLTTKPIIKVYYVEVVNQKNNQLEGRVYTQDVICTLERLTDLNFQQAMIFLAASINGFQAIFRVLGYVSIQPRNIGINSQNECKVWINSNFSLNTPDDNKIKNEDQIVHQIVRVVRSRTSQQFQCFFIKLSKHLELKKATFHEVQNYIKQCTLKPTLPSFVKIQNFAVTQKDLTKSKKVIFQTQKANSQHYFSPHNFGKTLKMSQIQKQFMNQQSIANDFQREESRVMSRSNYSNITKKRSPPKFLSTIQKKSPNHLKRKEKRQTSLVIASGQSSACSYFKDQIKEGRNTLKQLTKDIPEKEKSSISCLLACMPQKEKEKAERKISFSHQFTINIINDNTKKIQNMQSFKTDNIRESQGSRKMSERQTVLGSLMCESRRHLGGSILLQRDCLKASQPFNSQLFQKHFKGTEDHIRRKSGEQNYKPKLLRGTSKQP